MSMKQQCVQQFSEAKQWHWHVCHMWWQRVACSWASVV